MAYVLLCCARLISSPLVSEIRTRIGAYKSAPFGALRFLT